MKKEFKKIWNLALPYQDKRDDKGHAEIVSNYAVLLCRMENSNEDIVVPAAILHDIGWSQLPKGERFLPFDVNKTPEAEREVRIKHEVAGAELATEILSKVDYDPNFSKHIIEIVSQHDTRNGFFSKEDGLMRDADKLWRYCRRGFNADITRSNCTFNFLYNKRKSQIEKKNYFYSQSSKNIAIQELEDRKKESKEYAGWSST